jgi:hypothetical protein
MSGGGGGGDQVVGYRYLFGIHMGLCRGPVDELLEVRVGDRTAWAGSVTGNQDVSVDAYNLFGGEDGEGGVRDTLSVMMGGPDQVAASGLIAMLDGEFGEASQSNKLARSGNLLVDSTIPGGPGTTVPSGYQAVAQFFWTGAIFTRASNVEQLTDIWAVGAPYAGIGNAVLKAMYSFEFERVPNSMILINYDAPNMATLTQLGEETVIVKIKSRSSGVVVATWNVTLRVHYENP